MKLEDQVVSLELAKELKELGVEQDVLFSWIEYDDKQPHVELTKWAKSRYGGIGIEEKEISSAYSVAELGEMLPGSISEKIGNMTANSYFLDCGKNDSEHSYYVRYIKHVTSDTFCIMHESKESDARANCLIYLIKEGLVKEEEVEK